MKGPRGRDRQLWCERWGEVGLWDIKLDITNGIWFVRLSPHLTCVLELAVGNKTCALVHVLVGLHQAPWLGQAVVACIITTGSPGTLLKIQYLNDAVLCLSDGNEGRYRIPSIL